MKIKNYLTPKLRFVAPFIVTALGIYALATPHVVEAQDTSEKVQLMAETLRARDAGNLEVAKEKADELLEIAPDDENIQRLSDSIDRAIERSGKTQEETRDPSGGDAESGESGESAESAGAGGAEAAAEALAGTVASERAAKIEAAEEAIQQAEALAELGSFSEAASLLSTASGNLTLNAATADILDKLERASARLVYDEAQFLAENGQSEEAERLLETYISQGGDPRKARRLSREIDAMLSNPYDVRIGNVSPDFVVESKTIRRLLRQGRAQFLNGDYDGAAATFKEVEARDPNNAEAKLFSTRIARVVGDIQEQNYYKTREQMLTEVDQSWERPKVFDIDRQQVITETGGDTLQRRMENIVIPEVNFNGMELTRVIETLFQLSREYDPEGVGVNIVPLFDPNQVNPRVNISLRSLNLDRILDFITQQVNFSYSVGQDAVTVSRSDALDQASNTITDFFPISRATVIRLTGFSGEGGGGGSAAVDPFAAPSDGGGGGGGPSKNEEIEALRDFFQSAGVNFELPGTSLAYDGERLIVTQTSRNLERIRTLLRQYNEVKQVAIEAKFLEVSQNDLEEFGVQWNVTDGSEGLLQSNGLPAVAPDGNQATTPEREFTTRNRTVNDAFGVPEQQSAITVNDEIVANNAAPAIDSAIDLAANASSLFTASGWSINGYDVDVALRALARQSGSDLMSAPKVTVLSGKQATITVAQELRYPESYGDIESTSGGRGGSGDDDDASSSISITAGTPQDFVTRNVGVELSVTPNVENDDTISLLLEPRVTEFEGFVEYGGPSVAISGDTTVTIPAGFFQPVFSKREIATEVTIFDGATLVMGGLTRDEVKTVSDRVPVLGDIPGVGRLFRSEGETRQKRNLLIFVTANLISPGGSPSRQEYRNVKPNSLFQNPTIMTPSGTASRFVEDEAE